MRDSLSGPATAIGSLRFEQFADFVPDAVIGVGRDGLIALANTQAEELFDCSRADLVGQPVESLIPERFRGVHPFHREAYFADPHTRPMGADLEQARRQEAEREKRSLEEQLNQLRRMESVGQLAGGIAHDFNNILGVIINYADFVAEEMPDHSPASEDVAEIRRA